MTDDSGNGDHVGPFKSRVAGLGPEVGHAFNLLGQQATLNVRDYGEFWARHRLQGYAVFVGLKAPLGSLKQ